MAQIPQVRPGYQIVPQPNGNSLSVSAPIEDGPFGGYTFRIVSRDYDNTWWPVGVPSASLFGTLDPTEILEAMVEDPNFGSNLFAAADSAVANISQVLPAPGNYPLVIPPWVDQISQTLRFYVPGGPNMGGNLAAVCAQWYVDIDNGGITTKAEDVALCTARDAQLELQTAPQLAVAQNLVWTNTIGMSLTAMLSELHTEDAARQALYPS